MVELTHKKKSNIVKRTAETTKSAFNKLGKKLGKALIEGLLITALTVNPVFPQVNPKPAVVAQQQTGQQTTQQTSQQTQLHPELAKLKTISFSEVEKAVNEAMKYWLPNNLSLEEEWQRRRDQPVTFDGNDYEEIRNGKIVGFPIMSEDLIIKFTDKDGNHKGFRALALLSRIPRSQLYEGDGILDKMSDEEKKKLEKSLNIDIRPVMLVHKYKPLVVLSKPDEKDQTGHYISLEKLDHLYQLATGKEMKYVRLGFEQGTDETYGKYIEIHVIPVDKFQGEIKPNMPVLIFTYLIDKGKAYTALRLITNEETTSSK